MIPITAAPRARTRSTVRLVSVVVPDWLTATTRVSLMSSARPKPDSSVARVASTTTPDLASSGASTAAKLCAAMAAVPWPTPTIRRMAPSCNRWRKESGSVSRPRVTWPRLRRPRSVFRNDAGACEISFSR
jgi:hypothetical protein